jgi:RND superfamily putative drug exporter
VVVLWLAILAAGVLTSGTVFANLGANTAKSHQSESEQGNAMLAGAGPAQGAGEQVLAVIDGISAQDTALGLAVKRAQTDVAKIVGVEEVRTGYDEAKGDAPNPDSDLLAKDGKSTMVEVSLRRALTADQADIAAVAAEDRLHRLTKDVPGVRVRFGGTLRMNAEVEQQTETDTRQGELLSLPVTLVLLVLVFGGIRAASMPILGTLASVAGAMTSLYGLLHVVNLDPAVVTVTTVLSVGLAIDYGLLMVSRFREERSRRFDVATSVERTMQTAGRTVIFSGLTLATALTGLLLFEDSFYRAMGAASLSVVGSALLAALTLYPALLGIFGERIKVTGARRLHGAFFAWLARVVQRRPGLIIIACSIVLLTLGLPFFGMKLQNGGTNLLPVSFQSRQVADWVTKNHPEPDPVVVITKAPAATLQAYLAGVRAWPGVLKVAEPTTVGTVTSANLEVRGASNGPEAQAVVRRLHTQAPAFEIWVSGTTAQLVEKNDALVDRLPVVVGFIAGSAAVLLFLLTGSVLIPVKALLMNVLSLTASVGTLVFVFQDGHLSELLGVRAPGALETWIPVIVFIFSFGLSLDYEVFLLARIKEMRDNGLGNDEAVEKGLQQSGRIITTAALLIILVFLGFAAGKMVDIKEMGMALAIAVLLDATIVRCLLVPATMTLLGEANWWAPAWLRRLHDRFGMSESAHGLAESPVSPGPDRPGPQVYPSVPDGTVVQRVDAALSDCLRAGELGGGMHDGWVLVANRMDINGRMYPLIVTNGEQDMDALLDLLGVATVAWRHSDHRGMHRAL